MTKNFQQVARMITDDNLTPGQNTPDGCLCEPTVFYAEDPALFDTGEVCDEHESNSVKVAGYLPDDVLQPIVKWAGGKEKELKYIIPNVPAYDNYYEPFVGGGSVFTGIRANHYYINDFSEELVNLYRNISAENEKFHSYAQEIDAAWKRAHSFFAANKHLKKEYLKYRSSEISKAELEEYIRLFCDNRQKEICDIIGDKLPFDRDVLLQEMYKNLFRKMVRMNDLEHQKNLLPDKDLDDNIETAVKSAVYMCFRDMYNKEAKKDKSTEYYCALFLFIRNYSYSGMFRYNDNGDFNVPYGGIAYNSKSMSKKLQYYKSAALIGKFRKTDIFNDDFEDFLDKVKPTQDDFVFLDPPYDSEFSTYARNEFTRKDHERLADYMINRCSAKWMMIIKNTDFIFDLYNKPGIKIRTFDKEYLVSFMNRNDRKVTHLLITNY